MNPREYFRETSNRQFPPTSRCLLLRRIHRLRGNQIVDFLSLDVTSDTSRDASVCEIRSRHAQDDALIASCAGAATCADFCYPSPRCLEPAS